MPVKNVVHLESPALNFIPPRFLSGRERIRIADLARRGDGPTAIGMFVGRSTTTISREVGQTVMTVVSIRVVMLIGKRLCAGGSQNP